MVVVEYHEKNKLIIVFGFKIKPALRKISISLTCVLTTSATAKEFVRG